MRSSALISTTFPAHVTQTIIHLLLVLVGTSSAFSIQGRVKHNNILCIHQPRHRSSSSSTSTLASSSIKQSCSAETEIETIEQSNFLGDIYKLRIGGDDDFLGANAVPTFAAKGNKDAFWATPNSQNKNLKARGLEGALFGLGPAFVLDNVLSPEACEDIIDTCEKLQFGSYQAGKNFHGAMQIIVPPQVAETIAQTLCSHVDVDQVAERRIEMLASQGEADSNTHDVRLVYAGLNRRWRIYRYAPGGEETFAPHIDAGFPPSGLTEDGRNLVWDASNDEEEIVSRLTVLMYLNDDFVGGETKFYEPASYATENSVIASVRPARGSVLVFPQGVGQEAVEYARQNWPLHEGSAVVSGNRPKYVIRSDILFATTREPLPLEEHLFQNDHLVRQAFLPRTAPMVDYNFLGHLSSLYNPHMGVENLGPLLYSLIRFTKKRRIVEIGAGYTSLWIIQALKDNDDEFKRIQQLSQQDKCRLLNIQWANPEVVNESFQSPASLLCIDNCEHQKETATGACAVAKALGLDSYLQFLKGDAFEMADILEESSVEILWCDFGVGSRMKEFMSSGAWASLKPGGFLLCHSTLTNQRTRDWLEAARAHEGEEKTGIPPAEYVELSLLEPHKYFQNSVSIFQKRKAQDDVFKEPIFSEYA